MLPSGGFPLTRNTTSSREWFTFLPSGSRWIDVASIHVNKAVGLAQVMRYFGVTADEVMAFGDSMNDYSMLRFVGHPVVVRNACYSLRQIAERVIGPNTDHAVQRALRELLESLS